MSASRSIERRVRCRRYVVRALGALLALAAVAACGKKGNLELPPEDDDEETE